MANGGYHLCFFMLNFLIGDAPEIFEMRFTIHEQRFTRYDPRITRDAYSPSFQKVSTNHSQDSFIRPNSIIISPLSACAR